MSDLQRLQQLAEAVGWKVEKVKSEFVEVDSFYLLTISNGLTSNHCSLAPIAARLEAEYRKLAERAGKEADVLRKSGYPVEPCASQDRIAHFTRIADELAIQAPTQSHWYHVRQHALELIELCDKNERKEK